MAADLRLEKYVQHKVARGREYFYFRTVKHGKEFRRKLPHPFDAEYRAAYDQAHHAAFGTLPGQFESQTSVKALCRDHAKSERYIRLSKNSRTLRNLALDIMVERWGAFEAADIRPVHAQALYDSLASRPATANRRADDCSAVFGWGRLRGFCDDNPFRRIERVQSEESYEPWPEKELQKLISEGRPEIVKVALMAVYTGQRREDLLRKLTDDSITAGVWYVIQGKTKNLVPVPLLPVAMSIIDMERGAKRSANIVDPRRPLLTNSRGEPWTASGFGASWRTELIRLKLKPTRKDEIAEGEFRATFHGLRHTNATMIANAVARNPEVFGGIARVKAMLGHLTEAMSKHYARQAEAEHMNRETALLLPEIGKLPSWIGKQSV